MLCCLVGRVWGTARWGPAPAPCPLCPPQPPWAAGQWLSLPTLYESGLCCVFPRILVQQSWFSDHQPVSLSHSGTTTSGTRGERVSLPGASLKSSLSSFGGLLSAVSLQVLSCSAGQERGSWLVGGYKACLEGEKLFPQVCSYWESHEGGIFNPFLCCWCGLDLQILLCSSDLSPNLGRCPMK